MYNNDYVILIDENGQPYIAHGVIGDTARKAWGSLSNTATKYLEKVKTKAGKWRYIYNPEELKNLGKKAWGSKAGRFIDEHDAGISERLMAERQKRKANAADKAGRHEEANARRGKAMSLYRESKDEYANSGLKRGVDRLRDIAGYDERESAEIAQRNYVASANKYGLNKGEGSKTRALKEVADKQAAKYNKTLLGRYDSLKRMATKYGRKSILSLNKLRNK